MPAGRLNPLKLSVIIQNRRMNFTGVCVCLCVLVFVCVCVSICVCVSVCVFLCFCLFFYVSVYVMNLAKRKLQNNRIKSKILETRAQKRDLIPQARRSKRVDQGLSFERPCNRLPRGFPLQRYYKNKKNQPKTKIKVKQKESSF